MYLHYFKNESEKWYFFNWWRVWFGLTSSYHGGQDSGLFTQALTPLRPTELPVFCLYTAIYTRTLIRVMWCEGLGLIMRRRLIMRVPLNVPPASWSDVHPFQHCVSALWC